MAISVTDPISSAMRRARLITFQPFDIRKWFVLGFSAFLASLGQGGGCNFSGNWSSGGGAGGRGGGGPTTSMGQGPIRAVTDWISAHHLATALIVLAGALLLVCIYVLILWLSSRGRFMFMDGIARNVAEVAAPWKRYRVLGNSLFQFRVCLGVIWFVSGCAIAGISLLLAWHDIQLKTFGSGAVAALIVGVVLLLPTVILLGLVEWCTSAFVATIMYARGTTVLIAWREFRNNILAGNAGNLLLFFLMSSVLTIAVGLAAGLLGCLTLCIGFLPYLGSVVTLPLAVFLRSYQIYFLQQFGPEYTIMVEQAPPMISAFPVIMPPSPP